MVVVIIFILYVTVFNFFRKGSKTAAVFYISKQLVLLVGGLFFNRKEFMSITRLKLVK